MAKQRLALGIGIAAVGAALAWGAWRQRSAVPGVGPTATTSAHPLPVSPPLAQSFATAKAQIAVALRRSQAKDTDVLRQFALGHGREGLVRLDEGRSVTPAAAASWQVSADGDWQFRLRDKAAWSDGQPVKASDFVEAFKARLKAAHGTGPLARLRGAAAFAADQSGATELGAKSGGDADDLLTLSFSPALAEEDFDLLTAPDFMPLKIPSAKTLDEGAPPFNGPFVPNWSDERLLLKRNQHYWAQSDVGLEQIEVRGFGDAEAHDVEQAFLSGKLAFVDDPTVPSEDQLKAAPSLRHAGVRGAVYLVLNSRSQSLKNPDLRRAFRLAINREDLSQYTEQTGTVVAMRGLVPPGLPGLQLAYGAEYGVSYDANPRLAEEAFGKARKALGSHFPKSFPVVAQDLLSSRQELEHLRQWLLANHNIALKLNFLSGDELTQQFKKPQAALYYLRETAPTSDAAGYLKMVTEGDFASVVGATATMKKAAAAAIMTPSRSPDGRREQLNAVAQAEAALVEEAGVIGVLSSTYPYLQDSRLTHVRRRASGLDPDFTRTLVVGEAAAAGSPPKSR